MEMDSETMMENMNNMYKNMTMLMENMTNM